MGKSEVEILRLTDGGDCRDAARKFDLDAVVAGQESVYYVTDNYDHIATITMTRDGKFVVSDSDN